MEQQWPLVGRTDEMTLLLRRLRARRGGVVLAGPAGVGKTRLAADCLAVAADEGFVTIRVAGTQAASDLPLGCFAPLLPDLERETDRGETLRRIARYIVERGAGRPIALFVDDAHLLDDTSAVLTQQFTAGGEIFVLASVRSGVPAPDPVVAMWKDAVATRLELKPLTEEQVHLLLTEVLEKPVSAATSHLLHERSDGNVLFLRELVLEAVDVGALQNLDGMWHLTAELLPSARLIELVEARIGGLGDDSRQALELVALGEPVEVDLFTSLVGEEVMTGLERRQLVRISQDGTRLDVRLTHPMYGETLRASLSPRRSRSLYRSLAEALDLVPEESGTRRPDDLLRMATWQLRGGGRTQGSTMFAAARQAWSLHDAPLAEELARSAVDADAGLDGELLLATILSSTGRGEEAEERLAALALTTDADDARAEIGCARMDNLSFGLGRLEEGLAVAQEAEDGILDPLHRNEIITHRASLLSLAGRSADAVAALEPLFETAEGPTLVWCCRVTGYAAAQRGECSVARDIADRGLAAHQKLTTAMPFDHGMHTAVRVLALAFTGHLDEAEALARNMYADGISEGSVYTQIAMASSLCIIFTAQGRIATAIRWGRESAALSRAQGHPILLRVALSRLSEALALGGQLDEATRAITEMSALTSSFVRFGEADAIRSLAWIEAMRGDVDAARTLLERAVESGAETDNLVAVANAHHDLVRLGSPKHLDPLMDLSARIEGPSIHACVEHARARIARHPSGLLAASHQFEQIGAILLAAEAAADASAASERDGDGRAAAAAAHRSAQLLAKCEGGRTPALAATSQARGALSGRQLEIASLAAAGLSNKDIADRLCLSVRTVENKLHTAYQRLGVSGRSELADVLTHP